VLLLLLLLLLLLAAAPQLVGVLMGPRQGWGREQVQEQHMGMSGEL
jgi:hypothetical protein